MFILANFVERLEWFMFENKVTVRELPKNIEISNMCIYNYLESRRIPAIDKLIKFANFFDCSIDYLVGRSESIKTSNYHDCIDFSIHFQNILVQFNINYYRLSKETKISESVFFNWLKGKCKPKIENLYKVADYLDCSIDYLIGREK